MITDQQQLRQIYRNIERTTTQQQHTFNGPLSGTTQVSVSKR